jgi:hypothetical protein
MSGLRKCVLKINYQKINPLRAGIFPVVMPLLLLRQAPFQSRKARKIAIECNPLTSPFDRKGSEPRIGHARASNVGRDTKLFEDILMSRSWLNHLAMRLTKQVITKAVCQYVNAPLKAGRQQKQNGRDMPGHCKNPQAMTR